MSDTGSDYTEQTGMVSEFTLEREVRRERAAASGAAAADPTAGPSADPTNAGYGASPPTGGVTRSYSYRSGVEENKIPEEEEDLVGDDDDEISSSVISQKQQQQQQRRQGTESIAAGTGAHKSTAGASSSSGRGSSTSPSAGGAVQREKIQAAVGKARQASARAVQSVIQYERDHAIAQKAWAGVQQGVRYAGRKVRECTSVDTTTPN